MFWKKKPIWKEAPVYIQNCIRRQKQIEDIVDSYMKSIPKNVRHDDHPVVVKYGDLLKIWDKANLTKNDL